MFFSVAGKTINDDCTGVCEPVDRATLLNADGKNRKQIVCRRCQCLNFPSNVVVIVKGMFFAYSSSISNKNLVFRTRQSPQKHERGSCNWYWMRKRKLCLWNIPLLIYSIFRSKNGGILKVISSSIPLAGKPLKESKLSSVVIANLVLLDFDLMIARSSMFASNESNTSDVF